MKDIRRAVRRKYASRTNLERIFAQWDRQKKGSLDASDLFYGLNKVGIKTGLNDALALFNSAKQQDDNPELSINEFTDLVFSTDEAFRANLKNI